MSSERNEFEDLKRLLALKRHEQPPPGYFLTFSSSVLREIRIGNRQPEGFWEKLVVESPWVRQLWEVFERKPIFAGACSFAVCGLIAASVFYSDVPGATNLGTVPAGFQAQGALSLDVASDPFVKPSFVDFTATNALGNPALKGSLFDEVRKSQPPPQRAQSLLWAP